MAKAALYSGARLLMDKLKVERRRKDSFSWGIWCSHISPKHAMVSGNDT